MSDVPKTPGSSTRVASLDVIRGAVMILMAIDHVRVFSGLPAGGPAPGIFFTRWITHFCAPAFVFLAGTSAFLYGQRTKDRSELARYLLLRGAWLILLEMTFLRFAWTFNFDYGHYMLAGVIWVIGVCLILMAGLVYLPLGAVAAIGVTLVAGHNLIDPFLPQIYEGLKTSGSAWFWQLLYLGGPIELGAGGPKLQVLYVVVPWIGVMASGYAFGAIVRLPDERRRRVCLSLGLGMIAAFVVLRAFNLYGDPRPWKSPADPAQGMPAVLSFLNTSKYPASLLFLLMTLGPAIALVPLLDWAKGALARAIAVYGRAPLLYYLLHIPLIHAAACVVSLATQGQISPWLFENHPMGNPPPPDGYTWALALLYLVTAVVVILLYFPCRWLNERRDRHREAWMRLL